VIPATVAVRQGTTALTTSGVFRVEPISNTAAGCSSTTYSGNLCLRAGTITGAVDRELRYNENADRTLKGGVDRYNAFATVSRNLGDLEFFGEAGFYHAMFSGLREQSAPLASAGDLHSGRPTTTTRSAPRLSAASPTRTACPISSTCRSRVCHCV
jgi:hypothetical protein